MKISELIAELEKAMAEHGDVPVYVSEDRGEFDLAGLRWSNHPKWYGEPLPPGLCVD